MNSKVIARQLSSLLFLVASLMLPSAVLAYYDDQMRSSSAYFGSSLITFTAGVLFRRFGRSQQQSVYRREALIIVGLIWFLLGIFGSLPFMLEGSIKDFPSALFETVSGFTTTGATVISDIDGLSRATNLWRCLTHWIGGMGIVVLFVAIFPQLGVGAKHLFKTETAGPITEVLRPKIRQTALALWWIYATMTVACALLLHFAGMNWFDSICHAFSTLGTGGFSTRTESIGYYSSSLTEWILIAFMLMAGLNFGLYFGMLRGKIFNLVRNYEVKTFLVINLVVSGVIFYLIYDGSKPFLDVYRTALFQTAAVTSTTGFMTDDFDRYPDLARYLLFLCMFIGGCAGSTAGGMKVSRIYAAFKVYLRELYQVVKPQAVHAIKLGKTPVHTKVIGEVITFISAYIMLFAAASVFLIASGYSIMDGMSAVIACLSSIGPGFGSFGPAQNFGHVPGGVKYVLIFCMIAGRLEIFVLFSLFSPTFWRR